MDLLQGLADRPGSYWVDVNYHDRAGAAHVVEPVGRMLEATSDAELQAMAREVLREHPDAVEVEVRVRLLINHRRGLIKQVTARRGQPPSTIVREDGTSPPMGRQSPEDED